MTKRIYAPSDYDDELDRIAPDVTDLVNKARERYLACDPDDRDTQSVIDTELDALASVLQQTLRKAAKS